MKKWLDKIMGTLLSAVLCFTLFQIPGTVLAAGTALPVADVKPGLYREAKTVALSCATPGADIYYTTDNFMPDENSTKYETPIEVTDNSNITAIAVKDGVKSDPVTFSYLIKGAEEPKFQFVVMSDLHVDTKEKDENRVAKEFDVIHSIFPQPAAILIAGDLINDSSYISGRPNRKADHAIVKEMIEGNLSRLGMTDTKIQLCTGNHDAGAGAMMEYYPPEWYPNRNDGGTAAEKYGWTSSEYGWYSTEIEGYEFLFPNTEYVSSSAQRNWLKKEMAAATETDEGKPVFIAMHKPPYNTVMGGKGSASQLDSYNQDLANYSQAFTFSGHTHLDMHDDRSIYQKNFTALNTGSSSYIEVDGTYWTHSGEEYSSEVAQRFEMPVTQAYFVEVFEDRVEFDRVALNADWGDVKKTGFIPQEPFNNTGVIMGERWIVDLGTNGAEIKSKFRYTAPRRSAELSFPQGAEAKLDTAGQKIQVTFPQAQNVRKVKHYEILAKNESGETVATMKVLPENVFAPVPKALTYPFQESLPEGEKIHAEIVAVDSFGNRSSALMAEGSYDVPISPAEFTYMMNETFDKDLTDSSTQPIPTVDNWSGEARAQVADGQLQAVHVGPKGGANQISYQINVPLQPGTVTAAAKIPRGKYFVSADYEMNKTGKNGLGFILCDSGKNSFGIRVELTPTTAVVKQHNDSSYVTVGELTGTGFSAGHIRIGVDSAKGGVSKIMGVWLTPKDGTEVLVPGTENADMGDIGAGLTKLMLYPPIGADPNQTPAAGEVVGAMDNLKVWAAADDQLAMLAQKPATRIPFDQIKGENTDTQNVTKNLELSKVPATPNGLEIVGWQSSHPDIIDENGVVHLPKENTEVSFSPILRFPDPEMTSKEGYITGPGYPIKILVKVEELLALEDIYINETFDRALTNPAAQLIPTVNEWSGKAAARVADGKLSIVHTSGDLSYQMNVPLQPGDEKKTTPVPRGKTYVSWDWEMGPKTEGVAMMLCDKGKNSLGVRVDLTSTEAVVKLHNDSDYVEAGKLSARDFTSGHIKIGLDSTTAGATKIIGIWLTPNGGEEVLVENKNIDIGDIGTGIFKMMVYPNKLKSNSTLEANDVVVSMDNLKVWEPAEVSASNLFGWRNAYLTKDGKKVEWGNGTFIPEFSMQNYTGEAKSVVLIAAKYRDNKLEGYQIKTFDHNFPSNGKAVVQLEPITITDAASQTVKYFVWDSAAGIKPVKKIAQ